MANHYYKPDSWVILKIEEENNLHYRVLAGFPEKTTSRDDWRISREIVGITDNEYFYYIECGTGSIYECNKNVCELKYENYNILEALKQQKDYVSLMKPQKNWMLFDWNFKE